MLLTAQHSPEGQLARACRERARSQDAPRLLPGHHAGKACPSGSTVMLLLLRHQVWRALALRSDAHADGAPRLPQVCCDQVSARNGHPGRRSTKTLNAQMLSPASKQVPVACLLKSLK